MPATVEALFIVLVFVMPGFITLRVKNFFVPSAAKLDALQVTLESLTVSLFYVPVWLFSLPTLIQLRGQLVGLSQIPMVGTATLSWNIVALVLVHSLFIPAIAGGLWSIAIWNRWYDKLGGWLYPKLNIPPPAPGVGDTLWDRLWLNRRERRWLTVYMKDGRIYVGLGMEFALSAETREILLGPETRIYDKDWNFIRDLAAARGEGVWIPLSEVSSIDVHE